MPLNDFESAPGQRISFDGREYDIAARVATDSGPYVILNDAESGSFAALISEGNLRDHENVSYISTTVWAKMTPEDRSRQQAAMTGVPMGQQQPTTAAPSGELNQVLNMLRTIQAENADLRARMDAAPQPAQDPASQPAPAQVPEPATDSTSATAPSAENAGFPPAPAAPPAPVESPANGLSVSSPIMTPAAPADSAAAPAPALAPSTGAPVPGPAAVSQNP